MSCILTQNNGPITYFPWRKWPLGTLRCNIIIIPLSGWHLFPFFCVSVETDSAVSSCKCIMDILHKQDKSYSGETGMWSFDTYQQGTECHDVGASVTFYRHISKNDFLMLFWPSDTRNLDDDSGEPLVYLCLVAEKYKTTRSSCYRF